MSSAVLELKDLAYRVDGRGVLKGVSGAWPAGAAVALLGASGSGKSTLLKLIAGFLRPLAGEIRLRGVLHSGTDVHLPSHQRRVGMAFQNTALWPHMTVRETLAFAVTERAEKKEQAERVEALLVAFELADLADRKPHQLSGGQAQSVNLARAMAMDPDILLLDEPFTGMDPRLKTLLIARMKTLLAPKKPLILLATHYAQEALSLVDDIVLLRDGAIHYRGAAAGINAIADPYLRGFINP